MELEVGVRYLSMTLEVLLLDLLLSSDNIVTIALACRSLPLAKRKLGLVLGTGAAILLRVILTTGARFVLELPVLKLLGGLALIVIAIKLILAADDTQEVPAGQDGGGASLWSAVGTIIVADLVMSVDNVLGLAAIARGSLFILVMGLIISVPLLMFGSLFVGALLQRYPILIRAGGAMLGWFAGDIAVSDPMFAGWISQQAPALSVFVPLLAAVYVLAQVGVMRERRASAAALRPQPRVKAPVRRPARLWPWLARWRGVWVAKASVTGSQSTAVVTANAKPIAARMAASAPDIDADVAGAATPPQARRLPVWLQWPDRADWRIYERWIIASLGTAGLLLFAMRPPKALGTVLVVVALLGMTAAPRAHAAMRRHGRRSVFAIGTALLGLVLMAACLLLIFKLTGWLGPSLR